MNLPASVDFSSDIGYSACHIHTNRPVPPAECETWGICDAARATFFVADGDIGRLSNVGESAVCRQSFAHVPGATETDGSGQQNSDRAKRGTIDAGSSAIRIRPSHTTDQEHRAEQAADRNVEQSGRNSAGRGHIDAIGHSASRLAGTDRGTQSRSIARTSKSTGADGGGACNTDDACAALRSCPGLCMACR